jgi:hypothetical protein
MVQISCIYIILVLLGTDALHQRLAAHDGRGASRGQAAIAIPLPARALVCEILLA